MKAWDYLSEYERDRDEILAAVDRVFRSGRLILGDNVAQFEDAFASLCSVKHGIGVDNATSAATLTYKALGIGPGDEVVTVPLTAVPTASAIEAAGATPVFVDVEPRTLLMDVSQVEKAITPRTRAIVPVHLYGQCVDMDPLLEIAARRGIPVIEDCAQAHGATYKGRGAGQPRVAGSMGVMGTFSFYPTKPLATFGDGGMIVTNDEQLAAKLRRLRYYGMEKTYYAEEAGYNARLDEVHAAILNVRLKRMAEDTARRREIAGRYRDHVRGLDLVEERAGNRHVYHLMVARHARRDDVTSALLAKGVMTGRHYPWPLHTMRGFAHLGYREGDFPVAEAASREIFSLPMYASLRESDQDRVIAAVREIVGG